MPPEVELTNIYWEPDIGEVTIEVAKPGLAIGPGGSLLNDVKRSVGWTPKIIRTPPIASKTVAEIRGYIRQMAEERKHILRTVGRRLHPVAGPLQPDDLFRGCGDQFVEQRLQGFEAERLIAVVGNQAGGFGVNLGIEQQAVQKGWAEVGITVGAEPGPTPEPGDGCLPALLRLLGAAPSRR